MRFLIDQYISVATVAGLLITALYTLIASKHFDAFNKIQKDVSLLAKIFLVVAMPMLIVFMLAYLSLLYDFAKNFQQGGGSVVYSFEGDTEKTLNKLLDAIIEWYPAFDKLTAAIIIVLGVLAIFGAFGHYFNKEK